MTKSVQPNLGLFSKIRWSLWNIWLYLKQISFLSKIMRLKLSNQITKFSVLCHIYTINQTNRQFQIETFNSTIHKLWFTVIKPFGLRCNECQTTIALIFKIRFMNTWAFHRKIQSILSEHLQLLWIAIFWHFFKRIFRTCTIQMNFRARKHLRLFASMYTFLLNLRMSMPIKTHFLVAKIYRSFISFIFHQVNDRNELSHIMGTV